MFAGLALEFENSETNSFLEGMCSQVTNHYQSILRFPPLGRAECWNSRTVNVGRKRTRKIVVTVTIPYCRTVVCIPHNHQEAVQKALAGQERHFLLEVGILASSRTSYWMNSVVAVVVFVAVVSVPVDT